MEFIGIYLWEEGERDLDMLIINRRLQPQVNKKRRQKVAKKAVSGPPRRSERIGDRKVSKVGNTTLPISWTNPVEQPGADDAPYTSSSPVEQPSLYEESMGCSGGSVEDIDKFFRIEYELTIEFDGLLAKSIISCPEAEFP